jgi:type III secretion protein W
MPGDLTPSHVPPVHLDTARAQQLAALQEESQDNYQSWVDEGAFNPTLMARRFEALENKRRRTLKEEEAEQTAKKEKQVAVVERLQAVSDQFNQKNPELLSRSLLTLRARINNQDTKDQILRKVLEMYPDFSLADDALDFLLQTTDGSLAEQVRLAKEELNQMHGREVKAGKNIANQAREFSQQGLGTPTGLRNLYREVTGNPRDSHTLFNELTAKFSYDKMKTMIDFLLHSLGSDLKSRGPSIDRGELHRLLSETRKLQGILGIFRFYKSRMNLIAAAFERQGLQLPMRLNFELLAKQFVKALQERYPSADKIIQLSAQLGLSEEVLAMVIIFTQMRDGVRQTSPKLFKSNQHRQDLLNAFIDAIEELDERLEEEDEGEK